ncbi:SRPBCC family protein [Gordonia sp. C13]|uniref:SRPBCC family protein n=1 Tax=Gordonia sp. C13 TaxID=2935078 RepID=UPI002009DC1B|nr:SRPBCC family protein [Gordonia sp. C13]MCK8615422.1 SRPBCC family protein [Gordonia sp. C13]
MRQDLTSDSVSRHIDASPQELYDIVSDVTRTPELSSEIADVKWLDGATGPAVGARFRARNSAGRGPDWFNKPVITVADRGRAFAFERTEWIGGTLRWSYRFEPDATGTTVTESYEVTEPLNAFGWFLIGTLYGLKDRKTDLRQGMTETLERLAVMVRQPA